MCPAALSLWLHVYEYQGYNKLPANTRDVGCRAHARRIFDGNVKIKWQESRISEKVLETLLSEWMGG